MRVDARLALRLIGSADGGYRRVGCAALFALLALSACEGPIEWDKPNTTQQQFNTDNYACEKDARQSGYFGSGFAGASNLRQFFKECMIARGYTEKKS